MSNLYASKGQSKQENVIESDRGASSDADSEMEQVRSQNVPASQQKQAGKESGVKFLTTTVGAVLGNLTKEFGKKKHGGDDELVRAIKKLNKTQDQQLELTKMPLESQAAQLALLQQIHNANKQADN